MYIYKCMLNVYKNQQNRQTGSRNLMGPKLLPTIWGTYVKLVTKYQISVIILYLSSLSAITLQLLTISRLPDLMGKAFTVTVLFFTDFNFRDYWFYIPVPIHEYYFQCFLNYVIKLGWYCFSLKIIRLWRKPEYPERTTDPGQATSKLYHLRLRVECTLFCNLQTGREPTPYW